MNTIDLLAWCDPGNKAASIRDPWQQGGRAYATDGSAIIELFDPGSIPMRVDIGLDPASAFAHFDDSAKWCTIKPVPSPPYGVYRGGGVVGMDRYWRSIVPCPDCKRSNGCNECDWEGVVEIDHGARPFRWCGVRIKWRYAWLISQLPSVLVAPSWAGVPDPEVEPSAGIQFKFPGGRGMVAALAKTLAERESEVNLGS